MIDLAPLLKQRFMTEDGTGPLAGGLLYSFAAGTTTPLETFTDSTGLTENTNPVVLDADGWANVWMGDGAYKFVLTDADGDNIFTQDNVLSPAAQIAAALNTAGALVATNNLSDVASVPASLVNLGIAPFQYQKDHAITSGQSAANLTGETFDGTSLLAVVYEFLVIQGTTIGAWQSFVMIYMNGTWIKYDGIGVGTQHGITITVTQTTTVGQLQAAEAGLGNGTLFLKRHFVFNA